MARHLVYIFGTVESEGQACLDAVHFMAREYHADEGFTVIEAGIVAQKNGVDNPDAQITTKYDDLHLSPDGRYYFNSLSNFDDFGSGTQKLIDLGFVFTEEPFPEAWAQAEAEGEV